MNTPILSSTLFLTLLLMVGLFFFIRAAVKDRTQEIKLVAAEPEELILNKFKEYFEQRAYTVAGVEPEENKIWFQGFVRPSWFLAIFLTILAALGLICGSLVLDFLYPSGGNFFYGLTLLAPAAGVFYWQKAGRLEKVFLKLEALPDREEKEEKEEKKQSLITVTGHRDELLQLQQAFKKIAIKL